MATLVLQGLSITAVGLNRFWILAQNGQEDALEKNWKSIHKTIKKLGEDIEGLHYNTAISQLMILLRELESNGISKKQLEILTKLLAPFAPHITEEIWRVILKNKKSIHLEAWPVYDPQYLQEEAIKLIVQINGKVRDVLEIQRDLPEAEVRKVVLESEKVKKYLEGQKIKKFIYLPNRLVNIVI